MKNKFKRAFRAILERLIYPTSLCFTVVTLALYIIGTVLVAEHKDMIPTLRTILIVLAFSFVFCAANMLLSVKKLHPVLRVALHYVTTAAAFYILFISTSENRPGGSLTIILLLVYSVIYAAVFAGTAAVRSASRKKTIEKSDYSSIYSKL